ncbi:MAG: glycosyltransferase family 4 protein [Bacteroidales bacterium]|nr:glycosyltransferase family 4 protein [Bacteroidales bacterium]MCF8333906.1 glycosyltransferase family 4 protein [Bacteroidales bacterium]
MSGIDIVHYHLNPGGVTNIIKSQIESLQQKEGDYHIRLFCGDCPDPEYYKSRGVELVVDEIFNYADFDVADPKKIARIQESTEKAASKFFSPDRIIHFHNLTLAKNPFWTLTMYKLALKGYPIINHEHDFAEDRPDNQHFMKRIIEGHFGYNAKEVMYPDLKNYHMGVLNLFDYQRVVSYGFPESRLHYFPNPVDFTRPLPPAGEATKTKIYNRLNLDSDKKLITYPVRVIRRKNIGEYILLSHFFRAEANFVVTLPPKNPVEVREYKKWVEFCQKNHVPIVFEAGTKVDFSELISSSDFCVTTSTREGFGMAYLEPWMMNTPVTGRKLENILKDLWHAGLEFPALYDKFLVKDGDQWKDLPEIDFDRQRKIIHQIISNKELSDITFAKNSQLVGLFKPMEKELIENNQEIIKEKFSLDSYGERLERAYEALVG